MLLAGRGAAFSVTPESGTTDQLVVVQEVARQRIQEIDLPHLVAAPGAALAKHHGRGAAAVRAIPGSPAGAIAADDNASTLWYVS